MKYELRAIGTESEESQPITKGARFMGHAGFGQVSCTVIRERGREALPRAGTSRSLLALAATLGIAACQGEGGASAKTTSTSGKTATLVLGDLGLAAQAPVGTKVVQIGEAMLVRSGSDHQSGHLAAGGRYVMVEFQLAGSAKASTVRVSEADDSTPTTLEAAVEAADAAWRRPRDPKSRFVWTRKDETEDGYHLEANEKNPAGSNYHVEVLRTIGGEAHLCMGTVRTASEAAEVARVCQSLRTLAASDLAEGARLDVRGAWEGTLSQTVDVKRGDVWDKETISFPVALEITALTGRCGTFTLSSLGCAGELACGTAKAHGRTVEAASTITSGRDKCVDGSVRLLLAADGASLSWRWKGSPPGRYPNSEGALSPRDPTSTSSRAP